MSDRDLQQGVTDAPVPAGTVPGDGATAAPGNPAGQDAKQEFVPFFNEEYEFRLGALGDVATAYRLGAIFVLMLIGAVMMYLCAWWWVGTHPLAHQH